MKHSGLLLHILPHPSQSQTKSQNPKSQIPILAWGALLSQKKTPPPPPPPPLKNFKLEDNLKNFKMEDDLQNFKMEDNLKNVKMEDNLKNSGFRIWDSGFRIQDLGFRIWNSGFGIWDLRYCLECSRLCAHIFSHLHSCFTLQWMCAFMDMAKILCEDLKFLYLSSSQNKYPPTLGNIGCTPFVNILLFFIIHACAKLAS